MPFRLYNPRLILVYAMRIVLAACLALALLTGLVPASLSRAQQTCTMSCCAGKPPHAAGSCAMAFSDEHQAQTHATATTVEEHHHTEAIETQSSSTQAARPEIIEAADASLQPSDSASDCGTTEHSSAENRSTRRATRSLKPVSIGAHALVSPCSPECAAAAVSNLSQVRRPRATAVLTANSRPRPPTLASLTEQSFELQTSPAVICRQSRPRGPPQSAHRNPSASI